MKEVIVYSKNMCGYCVQAKNYLKSKDIKFKETEGEPILNVKSEEQEVEYIYKKKEKKQ